jgi:hypothetical protein
MTVTYAEIALFAWAILATGVALARGDKLKSAIVMMEVMLEKEDIYKKIQAEHLKRKRSA